MSVRASQEREFEAFVRSHGDALLRIARRLIPDAGEAEDALQTALLRLTVHWPKEDPSAYVRPTLVNIAKDRARRRHLVAEPTDAEHFSTVTAGPGDAMHAQAQLDAVLATRPARQRITVVLRILEGLSEAETAQVMGCSPGTVKSNLARGLDKVRALLTDQLAFSEEERCPTT